jgi:hypothetical protein
MRKEILALTEGDVVVLLPQRLAPRSQRQLKAWLSSILHDLDAADRAGERSTRTGSVRFERAEGMPIGSIAAG